MRRPSSMGGYCVAFAFGLLIARILPSDFLLFLLACCLVLLGMAFCKR